METEFRKEESKEPKPDTLFGLPVAKAGDIPAMPKPRPVQREVKLEPLFVPHKIWYVKDSSPGGYIVCRDDEHGRHWELKSEDGPEVQRFQTKEGATLVEVTENAAIINRVNELVKWLGYENTRTIRKVTMYREMSHCMLECDTFMKDGKPHDSMKTIGDIATRAIQSEIEESPRKAEEQTTRDRLTVLEKRIDNHSIRIQDVREDAPPNIASKKKMSLKDFLGDGWLLEANRLFFNPHGLAMCITTENGGPTDKFEIIDSRDLDVGILQERSVMEDPKHIKQREAIAKLRNLKAVHRRVHGCDGNGVQQDEEANE